MNFRKPLKRLLIITSLVFVLPLWQCNNKNSRYIYLKPSTTVYDTTGSVYNVVNAGENCSYANHIVSVFLPIDEYKTTSVSPFSSTAFADYPIKYPNSERILSFQIITLNDYNAAYPAGTDLSDTCIFYNDYPHKDSPYSSFHPVSKSGIISYLSYYHTYTPAPQHMSFHINATPSNTDTKLAIVFNTDLPSRFSDTVSINFKP
jgi:hypothetical protein